MTYDVERTGSLIDEFTICKTFEEDKKLAETLKPQPFDEAKQQWNDFRPLLENYLGSLSGRMGIPLNYITRINEVPMPIPSAPILEQYVSMAPLAGSNFDHNNALVYQYTAALLVDSTAGKTQTAIFLPERNGRGLIQALEAQFNGQGILSTELAKARDVLSRLYYSGEKTPPHTWDTFDLNLRKAYNIVRKHGQIIQEAQKVTDLLDNRIRATELVPTTEAIRNSIMLGQPVTFDSAMST